jgi:hypothetical protein
MNTKITALTLAAATAFAFTPKPASAGHNDGAVIAGAILGGLVVGAAIAAADDNCAPVYVESSYCPPPAPVYATGGYWTYVPVNVWIAPTWVVSYDRYGHAHRRYVAGHYERRNERRWVAHNRYDNHRGGHHIASNGNNHNRHDNDRRDGRRDDRRDNRRGHR